MHPDLTCCLLLHCEADALSHHALCSASGAEASKPLVPTCASLDSGSFSPESYVLKAAWSLSLGFLQPEGQWAQWTLAKVPVLGTSPAPGACDTPVGFHAGFSPSAPGLTCSCLRSPSCWGAPPQGNGPRVPSPPFGHVTLQLPLLFL